MQIYGTLGIMNKINLNFVIFRDLKKIITVLIHILIKPEFNIFQIFKFFQIKF